MTYGPRLHHSVLSSRKEDAIPDEEVGDTVASSRAPRALATGSLSIHGITAAPCRASSLPSALDPLTRVVDTTLARCADDAAATAILRIGVDPCLAPGRPAAVAVRGALYARVDAALGAAPCNHVRSLFTAIPARATVIEVRKRRARVAAPDEPFRTDANTVFARGPLRAPRLATAAMLRVGSEVPEGNVTEIRDPARCHVDGDRHSRLP